MRRNRIVRLMIFAIAAMTAAIAGACVSYATVEGDSAISAVNENGDIVYICSAYEDEIGEIDGLTYDESSNTLTMNGYHGGTVMINEMEDLKLELIGENTINRIPLSEDYDWYDDFEYDGILVTGQDDDPPMIITGEGTLSIGTSDNPMEKGISANVPLKINSYLDIYAGGYGIETNCGVTIGSKMHINSGMDPDKRNKSTAITCSKITFDGDFSFSDGYSIRNCGGWQIVAKAGAGYDGETYSGDVAHEVSVIDYINPTLKYTEYTFYCYGASLQNEILNQDKDFKWTTTNKAVATVTSKGLIKPQKPGTCKIKATSSTHTLICNVTVKKPAFDKTSLSMLKGDKEKLTVQGGKGKITWSSSNAKVAKVSSKGMVTAVKVGTCTITAKRGSYKCTAKVTVTSKPAFESGYLEIANGEQFQLKVVGGNGETTFSSDDESIATVDENGVVTGAGSDDDSVFGDTFIRGKRNGIEFICRVYNEGPIGDDIDIVTKPNTNVLASLGDCSAGSERLLRIRSSCDGYIIITAYNDWNVDWVEGWRGLHNSFGWDYTGYGGESLLPDTCSLEDYSPIIFATNKNEVYYISMEYFGGSGISGQFDDEQTSKECIARVRNVAAKKATSTTKTKAKSMKAGTKYTSVLYKNGDTAWYKFKVTKNKRFQLSLSSSCYPCADFYVYKGKKKVFLDDSHPYGVGPLDGTKSFIFLKSFGLGKGTYYVKVKLSFQELNGYYTLKWKYR